MKSALIILALFLVGCAQQRAERDHATCTSYSFQPGTADYGNCRLALQEMRTQRYNAAVQNYSNSLAIQRSYQGVTCQTIGTTTYCN